MHAVKRKCILPQLPSIGIAAGSLPLIFGEQTAGHNDSRENMAESNVGVGYRERPTSSTLTPTGVPSLAVTPQQQRCSVNDNIAQLTIDPVV
jgi:hypothetical protein